jgi:hypothetical protein
VLSQHNRNPVVVALDSVLAAYLVVKIVHKWLKNNRMMKEIGKKIRPLLLAHNLQQARHQQQLVLHHNNKSICYLLPFFVVAFIHVS